MMKKITAAITLLTVFLCGCAKGTVDLENISSLYQNAVSISAQVRVLSRTDVMIDYTLDYRQTASETRVTITEPLPLAGISASIIGGGAKILFDGVALETLLPGVPGFSPVDAMSGLIADLRGGLPQDYSVEKRGGGDAVAVTYSGAHEEYSCEKRVWLDAVNYAIKSCEFYLDGQLVMTLETVSISIF